MSASGDVVDRAGTGPTAGTAGPAAPAQGPVLEVEGLTISLRTARGLRRAVDGISFSIDRAEILGIAGESGSG